MATASRRHVPRAVAPRFDNLVRTSRKPSGGWSKPFKMKLGEFVERLSQNRKTIMNGIATIILAVLVENTEFKTACPTEPWNKIYFALLIVMPFIIIVMLNFIIQVYFLKSFNDKKDKWCRMAWESSFPAWMWIVIVFLNGEHRKCALFTHFYGLDEAVVSEIVGLILRLIIVIVVLIHFWVKNKKPKQHNLEEVEEMVGVK